VSPTVTAKSPPRTGASRPSDSPTQGALIRELRLRRKLTQETLAAGAGISTEHLSRIETGKHEPSLRTIEKIAPLLGVTAGYLNADALGAAVAERLTDPETRAFVERVAALHNRIAVMTAEEREALFNLIDEETRQYDDADPRDGGDGGGGER
jgi:transcriptional regulator with XRE-family HTH domain